MICVYVSFLHFVFVSFVCFCLELFQGIQDFYWACYIHTNIHSNKTATTNKITEEEMSKRRNSESPFHDIITPDSTTLVACCCCGCAAVQDGI